MAAVERGQVVVAAADYLRRECRQDGWLHTDAAERERIARRLAFAAWRWNPSGDLHRRSMGTTMMSKLVGALAVAASVAYCGLVAARQWIWGRGR